MTERSDRIQRLLDDPDLKQAFQDVRDALHQAFEMTSTTDAEKMLDIRKRLHLLESVEENLIQAIRDGKLEDFNAAEKERPPFLGDLVKWRMKQKM
ncbi:MAG: hypothetical protein ACYTFQ_16995 [Planctomycetota bacterium]|jgi:hypothetical protein